MKARDLQLVRLGRVVGKGTIVRRGRRGDWKLFQEIEFAAPPAAYFAT